MKKLSLRLSLMGIALMLFSVNPALADVGDVIFHETFDVYSNTGGNNGVWDSSSNDPTSISGWTLEKVYGADRCVRVGASKNAGIVTTPAITTFESGKTYTLIFRMGGWTGDTSKSAKLSLSKGKVDGNDSKLFSITTEEFVIYTATLTGVDETSALTIKSNTGSKNRFFLDEIKIVEGNKINVTIASSGWSSLATPVGLDFSGVDGLTAFVASSIGKGVNLTSVNEAAGATGVMLKGTAGATYSIPIKAAATTSGTNKLSAAYSKTPAAANELYILKGGMLCLVNAAGSNVPAGKAYLLASEVPGSAHDLAFNLDEGGDVTAINNVEATKAEINVFYNLAGQRVAQPTKGLYIVNGKKVIMK